MTLNDNVPSIRNVACGENHSTVITTQGKLYSWGHAGEGRLGLRARERVGVPDNLRHYFPVPSELVSISHVQRVVCGKNHTLALTEEGLWSWGNGSGGKLGLGSHSDHIYPTLIEELKGRLILDFDCSTWNSAAVVVDPPLTPKVN